MADDCGRVNPVSPHYLNRGAREEPYQGRPSKRHPGQGRGNPDPDTEATAEESAVEPAPGNHIDLRI